MNDNDEPITPTSEKVRPAASPFNVYARTGPFGDWPVIVSKPVEPLVRLAPGVYLGNGIAIQWCSGPSMTSVSRGGATVMVPPPGDIKAALCADGDSECRRVAALLGIPVVEPASEPAQLTPKGWSAMLAFVDAVREAILLRSSKDAFVEDVCDAFNEFEAARRQGGGK